MLLQNLPRISTYILVTLLFCSCNNDPIGEDLAEENIELIVIGADIEHVYQYDFQRVSDQDFQTNLSSELGISTNYLTLRQFKNTLSFYSLSNNAISLSQKDLLTGSVTTYPQLYPIDAERSLVWGFNDDDFVYFGVYKPVGSTNFVVRAVNISTLEGKDKGIESGINQLYDPLYANDKLFITYISGNGNYKIVVYDTIENDIGTILEYGTVPPSILINDEGNLAVFTSIQNENTVVEIIDSDTYLSLSKINVNIKNPFTAGPVNATLKSNTLYYQYTYPQPFQIERGPAILDLNTGENTIIDLVALIDDVNLDVTGTIRPFYGSYLSTKDIFAISFAISNATDNSIGGFLLLNNKGKLLVQKKLNFIPSYFVD